MSKDRPRYYRETIESIAIMLLSSPIHPVPEPGTTNGEPVRLWRFAEDRFQCVWSAPWDGIPLWDQGKNPDGFPCLCRDVRSDDWQHRLIHYQPIVGLSGGFDAVSDVWTAPPWVRSVSMKIMRRRVNSGLPQGYDVLGCSVMKNAEESGTLMLYPAEQGEGS